MKRRSLGTWALLTAAALSLPACTIRGTTQQITDTTQNTTVTTSGRSWFTGDGVVRNGEQANAFVALNMENLKQDLACGTGEYLTAVSALLGVRYEDQATFFELAQHELGVGMSSWQDVSPAELIAGLHRAIAAHAVSRPS